MERTIKICKHIIEHDGDCEGLRDHDVNKPLPCGEDAGCPIYDTCAKNHDKVMLIRQSKIDKAKVILNGIKALKKWKTL